MKCNNNEVCISEELKPCPFCGSTELHTSIPDEKNCGHAYIRCDCGAFSPREYEKHKLVHVSSEAVLAWNRRVSNPKAGDIMPCPFCGGRYITCSFEEGIVKCEACGAMMKNREGFLSSWKFSVNAWNMRKGFQILPEIEYVNPYRWKDKNIQKEV